MKKSRRSLIRLAENPFGDEDELTPPSDDQGGDDEDPFADEGEEDDDEMSGMYSMQKGRRVAGPRTKLSLDKRIDSIEKGLVSLAETVASLAKSNSTIGKAVLARLAKEDDEDEKDEKEDKARLRKEDYESDTGIGGTKDAGDDRTSQEETENELGITGGDLAKGRKLAKDDAASSFGEKDSDIPGNKPAGIDEKDKSPGDYLLQGDASDGPGPVSNAMKADLDKAVAGVLAKHGVIFKAQGPRTGVGSPEPEPDMDKLEEQARGLSFRELNRMRVQAGELPDGLI